MKIKSSLKSIKKRDLNSKLVARGKLYVINKKNPKFSKTKINLWIMKTIKILGIILQNLFCGTVL